MYHCTLSQILIAANHRIQGLIIFCQVAPNFKIITGMSANHPEPTFILNECKQTLYRSDATQICNHQKLWEQRPGDNAVLLTCQQDQGKAFQQILAHQCLGT